MNSDEGGLIEHNDEVISYMANQLYNGVTTTHSIKVYYRDVDSRGLLDLCAVLFTLGAEIFNGINYIIISRIPDNPAIH